ncbi:hypothetical protein N7513_000741 [Penicillium frequentans]|nr:hypothetical protein N7513_000741 [Penicillium glabrum]
MPRLNVKTSVVKKGPYIDSFKGITNTISYILPILDFVKERRLRCTESHHCNAALWDTGTQCWHGADSVLEWNWHDTIWLATDEPQELIQQVLDGREHAEPDHQHGLLPSERKMQTN